MVTSVNDEEAEGMIIVDFLFKLLVDGAFRAVVSYASQQETLLFAHGLGLIDICCSVLLGTNEFKALLEERKELFVVVIICGELGQLIFGFEQVASEDFLAFDDFKSEKLKESHSIGRFRVVRKYGVFRSLGFR